mmetsp:Transcript_19189/g.29665  ORF Transcript_19189/g.29665 Transcript_19189/m.29665 type:complete len:392 (+) Transcript_19189:159-1334(+)
MLINNNLSGNLGVDGSNVLHEVNNTGRVTPLVIIPGNKLDERRVEHDTGTGIKDTGARVRLEIGRNQRLITVSEDTLHLTLRLGLDDGADLLIGGLLTELAGQINDGNINGGDTECHTGKLALKLGDDLGHSLGSSSGGGDDVTRSGTSSTPVLAGRRVHNSLSGSHSVNGSHEGLLDTELIIDGLDHGGKTVGGTGSAGDVISLASVLVLVNSNDAGQGVILSRGRVDDLLGSSIDDGLGLLLGKEDTGGLAHVFGVLLTPADLGRIAAVGGGDLLSVEDQESFLGFDGSLGDSVDGIVLVLVGHVIGGGRSSVDGVDFAVIVFHDDTGYKTSDTSESVDSHSGGHLHGGLATGNRHSLSREAGSGEGGGSSKSKGGNGKLHLVMCVLVL